MYWTLMDNFEVRKGITWECPLPPEAPPFVLNLKDIKAVLA